MHRFFSCCKLINKCHPERSNIDHKQTQKLQSLNLINLNVFNWLLLNPVLTNQRASCHQHVTRFFMICFLCTLCRVANPIADTIMMGHAAFSGAGSPLCLCLEDTYICANGSEQENESKIPRAITRPCRVETPPFAQLPTTGLSPNFDVVQRGQWFFFICFGK